MHSQKSRPKKILKSWKKRKKNFLKKVLKSKKNKPYIVTHWNKIDLLIKYINLKLYTCSEAIMFWLQFYFKLISVPMLF